MSGWQLVQLILAFIVIVGAVYGLGKFIDSRVEQPMKGEEFLRRIASHLRPTAIVDDTGAVLIDQGAMEFIDRITLTRGDKADRPRVVQVAAKKH